MHIPAFTFPFESDEDLKYSSSRNRGKNRWELPCSQNSGTSTKYTANLQAGSKFFADELAKLKPIEVEDVFSKLTNRFRFNEYELESDFDVFVASETMNLRGKQLSKLELLKNRLIYLSTLIHSRSP